MERSMIHDLWTVCSYSLLFRYLGVKERIFVSKAEENTSSQERVIWDMYEEKCRSEGKKPTVQDFKAWTTTLLKSLK